MVTAFKEDYLFLYCYNSLFLWMRNLAIPAWANDFSHEKTVVSQASCLLAHISNNHLLTRLNISIVISLFLIIIKVSFYAITHYRMLSSIFICSAIVQSVQSLNRLEQAVQSSVIIYKQSAFTTQSFDLG